MGQAMDFTLLTADRQTKCIPLSCTGEEAIGARAYRVIFAAISLPLAVLAVVYFINHRYDGTALWYLRRQPFIEPLCWILNFISFYFLYPSTFNLLEVSHAILAVLPSQQEALSCCCFHVRTACMQCCKKNVQHICTGYLFSLDVEKD